MLYAALSASSWRQLPHDYPPWGKGLLLLRGFPAEWHVAQESSREHYSGTNARDAKRTSELAIGGAGLKASVADPSVDRRIL